MGVGVGGRWADGWLEGGLVGVDGVVGAGSWCWAEADGFWTARGCVSSVPKAGGEEGGNRMEQDTEPESPFCPGGAVGLLPFCW